MPGLSLSLGQSRARGTEHEELMSYTKGELDAFRTLVEMGESQDQMKRIMSRIGIPRFIEEVGQEKCDEMFEILKQELDNR